jgi:hypothetical protein
MKPAFVTKSGRKSQRHTPTPISSRRIGAQGRSGPTAYSRGSGRNPGGNRRPLRVRSPRVRRGATARAIVETPIARSVERSRRSRLRHHGTGTGRTRFGASSRQADR